MRRLSRTHGIAMSVSLMAISGCGDSEKAPNTAGEQVSITAGAFTLQTMCSMTITIENSYTEISPPGTVTLWSQTLALDANNQAEWIGPCVVAQDIDGNGTPDSGAVGSQNTITIKIDSYTVPGPDGICGNGDDLTPASLPTVDPQSYICQEEKDTLLSFDILIEREANQGFVDVTFEYDELFCSCKRDCLDAFLPDPTATSYASDGACSEGGGVACATSSDCPANTCVAATCTDYDGACSDNGEPCTVTDLGLCGDPAAATCNSAPDTRACNNDGALCVTDDDCGRCSVSGVACSDVASCDDNVCQGATLIHTEGQRAPTIVPIAAACSGGGGSATAVGLWGAQVCCCVDLTSQVPTLANESFDSTGGNTESFTLTNTPVVPGSLTITVQVDYDLNGDGTPNAGDVQNIADDGAGGLVAQNGAAVNGTIDYATGAVSVDFGSNATVASTGGISVRYSYYAVGGPDGKCDDPDLSQCVTYDPATGWPSAPVAGVDWYGGAAEYDGSESVEGKEYNNQAVAFDIDWYNAHSSAAEGWMCGWQAQTEIDIVDAGDPTDPESLQGSGIPGDFSLYSNFSFYLDDKYDGLQAMCAARASFFKGCGSTRSDILAAEDKNDILAQGQLTQPFVLDELAALPSMNTVIREINYVYKSTELADMLGYQYIQASGDRVTNVENLYAYKVVAGVSVASINNYDALFAIKGYMVTANGEAKVMSQADMQTYVGVDILYVNAATELRMSLAKAALGWATGDGFTFAYTANSLPIARNGEAYEGLHFIDVKLIKELPANTYIKTDLQFMIRNEKEGGDFFKDAYPVRE